MSNSKEIAVASRESSIDRDRNNAYLDLKGPTVHATSSNSSTPEQPSHGIAQVILDPTAAPNTQSAQDGQEQNNPDNYRGESTTWKQKFQYFKTKDFWVIMALGQFLALCLTGTNTLSQLLNLQHTSIPAFQSFFLYVLLNISYGGYTVYKYGPRKWGRMVLKDGWKYIILAFFDVEGNYFTVLAYQYTTILSAQLINFWAIVIVVIVSFVLLKVRYHWAQIIGILICVGGMGILLASDHIQGVNGTDGGTITGSMQLKGDMFAVIGATAYGLSNVYEEWFVSGRPLYEVIGQLGFWGMIINGVQAGIFDRQSFKTAVWNAKVGGYLTGYTLILFVFYTCVPILYRLSSAAFFNISLLTGNFWAIIIGTKVFGNHVHFLYPIAFTLIMVGHFVYYLGKGVLGEAKKAWLGERQEKGVSGFGTARRKIERGNVVERRSSIEAEGAGIV